MCLTLVRLLCLCAMSRAQDKLEKALTGAGETIGPKIEGVIAEAGYYADHHISMLTYIGACPPWEPFQQLVDTSIKESGGVLETQADGAAGQHSHAARYEAARKIVLNHNGVLCDMVNPSPKTQLELVRVGLEYRHYVDQALRETVRRLLGKRAGIHLFEERVDPSMPAQSAAWRAMATYLSARVQGMQQQMPGREPDMGAEAAAALRAALQDVGADADASLASIRYWACVDYTLRLLECAQQALIWQVP